MTKQEIDDVLNRAAMILQDAKLGFEDLTRIGSNRRSQGLRNLAVFGRAFTNVLQNIRTFDRTGFDEWYHKYKDEMKKDELMRFFVKLRNEILKEGKLPTGTAFKAMRKFELPTDLEQYGPKPAGATTFFWDAGGIGWIVPIAVGIQEKYYVEVPDEVVSRSKVFMNPPRNHLAKRLQSNEIVELSRLYLEYLERMYDDARKHFLEANVRIEDLP